MDERILEILYLSNKSLNLTKERRDTANACFEVIRDFLGVDKLPTTLARPFIDHIDHEIPRWSNAEDLEKLLLKTKEIMSHKR